MSNLLDIFKSLIFFLLVILSFLLFEVDAAFAHEPHDIILEVEISPSYNQDQTLFVNTRGTLLKSEDGGKSWKKKEKRLDNKHKLSSLAISSQSKKTLFLSSVGDGIYKSQDEGASWFKVNQGLETLNIDLVSISPNSSEVVLVAGTEKGLYKTKNGGSSWYRVLDGENKITAIAFSPEQKDQIVIGDRQGILYESSDGGEGWKQLFTIPNSGAIKAIAFSPYFSGDRTFFVGTEKGGIFKTVDGGISFQQVNDGLSDQSIVSLAMSPNYGTDSTLFACAWQEGVFYSNDGGNTWKKYRRGLTKTSQADEYKRPHFSDLGISPTFTQDQTIFLAGFDGLFKSTDGGRIWRESDTTKWQEGIIESIALSPDYRNDSTVAITTRSAGGYISNNQGFTWTIWTAINKRLAHSNYLKLNRIGRGYGIFFSPNYRSDKTIFSGRWGHFLRSTDGGKHWNKIPLTNQSGWLDKSKGIKLSDFRIAVSPTFASDDTIYLGMLAGGILRSTDGGENFSIVGNVGQTIWKSLVMSPDFSSDKTLYASTRSGGVYKTVDEGYTWQDASNGLAVEGGLIKLAISPSYKVDKTVWAGTTEGLFETQDGGENWRKLAGTAYGGDGYIEDIVISPNYKSDRTFIVGVKERGLFKTVNGGKSFTQIGDPNMKSFQSTVGHTIQFSPSYSIDRTIYVSSNTEMFKLFKSTDGGNSWETLTIPKLNYNFMHFLYLRLTLHPKRRFLAALIAALFALLSYLFFGYLGLEKKLPFRKLQIRAGGAFAAFIVVLILLSV